MTSSEIDTINFYNLEHITLFSTELPDMSGVMPSIDKETITETTIKLSFTQWNPGMPGYRPEKYKIFNTINDQPTSTYLKTVEHVNDEIKNTITLENITAGTNYSFHVTPVINVVGTDIDGIPTANFMYIKTGMFPKKLCFI